MAVIPLPNPTSEIAAVPVFPYGAVAITPSDTDTFAEPVSVYVGVGGNMTVRPGNGGAAVAFVGLTAGACLPIQVIGVNATGLTAASLVAIY